MCWSLHLGIAVNVCINCGFVHLLVINNSKILVYLAAVLEIRRFVGSKLRIFLPRSHLTPSLGVNPFEFLNDFRISERPFIAKTTLESLSNRRKFLDPSLRRDAEVARWRDAEDIEGVRNGEGVPLPSRLRGLGKRCKLPQQGPGRSPAENEFGAPWSCQKATGGNHFEYSAVHVLH